MREVGPIHLRSTEEVERERCDATSVVILATSPDNDQTKKKKKLMMQVNIRRN